MLNKRAGTQQKMAPERTGAIEEERRIVSIGKELQVQSML
jgi:hypothetical protein